MGLIPEPKKTVGLLLHYFSMTGVHSRQLRGTPGDKAKGGKSYSAKDLGRKSCAISKLAELPQQGSSPSLGTRNDAGLSGSADLLDSA